MVVALVVFESSAAPRADAYGLPVVFWIWRGLPREYHGSDEVRTSFRSRTSSRVYACRLARGDPNVEGSVEYWPGSRALPRSRSVRRRRVIRLRRCVALSRIVKCRRLSRSLAPHRSRVGSLILLLIRRPWTPHAGGPLVRFGHVSFGVVPPPRARAISSVGCTIST